MGLTMKICGQIKMDDAWIAANADQLHIAWPRCRYCGRLCRKGSIADHLWPHCDDYSMHLSCRARRGRPRRKAVSDVQ